MKYPRLAFCLARPRTLSQSHQAKFLADVGVDGALLSPSSPSRPLALSPPSPPPQQLPLVLSPPSPPPQHFPLVLSSPWPPRPLVPSLPSPFPQKLPLVLSSPWPPRPLVFSPPSQPPQQLLLVSSPPPRTRFVRPASSRRTTPIVSSPRRLFPLRQPRQPRRTRFLWTTRELVGTVLTRSVLSRLSRLHISAVRTTRLRHPQRFRGSSQTRTPRRTTPKTQSPTTPNAFESGSACRGATR